MKQHVHAARQGALHPHLFSVPDRISGNAAGNCVADGEGRVKVEEGEAGGARSFQRVVVDSIRISEAVLGLQPAWSHWYSHWFDDAEIGIGIYNPYVSRERKDYNWHRGVADSWNNFTDLGH